jgi:hypothetical protein
MRPLPCLRRALRAGLLAAALPLALAAQTTVMSDVALYSRYEWRGVTFANRPVLQPDLIVTTQAAGGSITTGAWANLELAGYNGPEDMSVVGGQLGTAVTAYAFWTEYSRAIGLASVTVGTNGYLYPRANGAATTYNSVEPYAKLALALPLAPRVAVFYDAVRVRGTYVEAAVTQAVPAGASHSVFLTATVGASSGQNPRPDRTAYYSHDGITAVDLAASTAITRGLFTVTPTVHLTLGHDDYARIITPKINRGTKIWFGGTMTWAQGSSH